MKLILSAICAITLTATPVLAGKRIKLETTGLPTPTQREILLDAGRVRINDGNTSVIFLTEGGNRIVTLDKTRNEYREIDQALRNTLAQGVGGALAQLDSAIQDMPPELRASMEAVMKNRPPIPPVVTTSYSVKGPGAVNEFVCTNYDGTREGQKVLEVCAAEAGAVQMSAGEYQTLEKMADFMQALLSAGNPAPNSVMAKTIAQTSFVQSGFIGFAVRTQTFSNGQLVAREMVTSVVDASFTDADFSTGSATKLEVPGGLGARAR